MARELYLNESRVTGGRSRRILIAVMAVVLVAATVFGVYLKSNRDTARDILIRFQESMTAGKYEEAVDQLRDVQARVAGSNAAGGNGAEDILYRESLASMEKIVTERVDAILASTGKAGAALSADDRGFLEGMGELTGMLVSAKLRTLCAGLLTGTAGRAEVDSAFGILGSLSNLSQPTRLLRQELDAMEKAAPPIRAAEAALAAGTYFDALRMFGDVASTSEGFVKEYVLGRVQYCKDTMLSPLALRARAWLDAGRTYSARDLLAELKTVFPDNANVDSMLKEAAAGTAQKLEVFPGTVEHITLRPLIVTPSRAFDGDEFEASLSQGMLTVKEFRALLDGLYAKGYILIDIESLLSANGQAASLQVPVGKKPLILTLETVNYYAHRAANGMCSNLVLDKDGRVCGEFLDSSGNLRVEREAEAIGILETFVEQHPDFSFDGAKGVVSLTGYECVFGYVTNKDQLLRRNENNAESGLPLQNMTTDQMAAAAAQAKAVVTRLKDKGWRVASSTYGYLEPGNASTTLAALQDDARKWNEQVGAITGTTDILMYPNGSFLNGDDPKCMMLRGMGFRFFAGIGPQAYTYYRENYVYMDKTAINGYALTHDNLSRFFDAKAAKDPARPA
ncbi:MAG TPA: hypothetical protein VIL27_07445 [Clostridia bacterium]